SPTGALALSHEGLGAWTLGPRSIWMSWEEADMTKLDFISSPKEEADRRRGSHRSANTNQPTASQFLTLRAKTYCCCCCSCSVRELSRANTGRDWMTMLGAGGSGGGASDGLTVTATLSVLWASPLCTPRVGGTSA